MRKVGGMAIGQVVKLILAVAVTIILLMLLAKLFVPLFDKGDETAKSYSEMLKEKIGVADDGGVSEFFMWYLGGSDKEFFLVYFGDGYNVEFVKVVWEDAHIHTFLPKYETFYFNSVGTNKNRVCVCTVEGNKKDGYDSICRYCKDLDHPVEFPGKNETWYSENGKRIGIELEGDKYVFKEI